MNKKIAIICAMLLASSINIKAANFKVQMPIEFVINAQDPENPRAEFSTDYPNIKYPSIRTDFKPGLKWVMLPQLAAMFDPSNPSEPVVLLDVRRTILKIIAQNPELVRNAGIQPEDFVNAGISTRDLQVLRHEDIRPEEISFLAQLMVDFIDGDTYDGLAYMRDGGLNFVKGGAGLGFGTAILLKKATVVVAKFLKSCFDDVTESEKEARASID